MNKKTPYIILAIVIIGIIILTQTGCTLNIQNHENYIKETPEYTGTCHKTPEYYGTNKTWQCYTILKEDTNNNKTINQYLNIPTGQYIIIARKLGNKISLNNTNIQLPQSYTRLFGDENGTIQVNLTNQQPLQWQIQANTIVEIIALTQKNRTTTNTGGGKYNDGDGKTTFRRAGSNTGWNVPYNKTYKQPVITMTQAKQTIFYNNTSQNTTTETPSATEITVTTPTLPETIPLPTPSIPVTQPETTTQIDTIEPEPEEKKNWKIWIGLTGLIVIIGGLLYCSYKNKNKDYLEEI